MRRQAAGKSPAWSNFEVLGCSDASNAHDHSPGVPGVSVVVDAARVRLGPAREALVGVGVGPEAADLLQQVVKDAEEEEEEHGGDDGDDAGKAEPRRVGHCNEGGETGRSERRKRRMSGCKNRRAFRRRAVSPGVSPWVSQLSPM